ncbi:MAG: histidine kinase dimerization/phosphoacceptor domain -containing protein [Rhizomicrobium sp.]
MASRTPLDQDIALSLPLALVEASNVPLLLLDKDFTVIAASMTFCQSFAIDTLSATGRKVFELGDGEWNTLRLRSALNAAVTGNAPIESYEFQLVRVHEPSRQLILNIKKITYLDSSEGIRLLLTVADVTDARMAEKLKNDLLREKEVLLQELQHRVANSLQIIASILMQNARKVQSAETRGHLQDAHHRVMSVAAVQQQLVASTLGKVKLRPYFQQLCDSLGASMIADRDQLSLEVTGDDSTTSADDSVSLGLIVTELVINALKHAFPQHRNGKIVVDYSAQGSEWRLSVSDNGIGMPAKADSKPGLGTSIVEALANQLQARVGHAGANPGTSVSIVHP